MKDKLIQLIQKEGEFIRYGHWRIMHLFDGASHPQAVKYIVIDGRDYFFLSGDPIFDIDWLYQELTA